MEYYFNELSPVAFQRLINSILTILYGEHVRLTPLRGSDGGRDAEIAPNNPKRPHPDLTRTRPPLHLSCTLSLPG